MRILATGILAIAIISTAAPAWPQTYDPDYPVCPQSYGMGGGAISWGSAFRIDRIIASLPSSTAAGSETPLKPPGD